MLILVGVGLSTIYLMQIIDDQDARLGTQFPCYFCNNNYLIDQQMCDKFHVFKWGNNEQRSNTHEAPTINSRCRLCH